MRRWSCTATAFGGVVTIGATFVLAENQHVAFEGGLDTFAGALRSTDTPSIEAIPWGMTASLGVRIR